MRRKDCVLSEREGLLPGYMHASVLTYTHLFNIHASTGSTEIFASNSEKSGSVHGSYVAAIAMGGRGHGGHVTNLPILKRENCTSLKAGHDNRVSYAFLHRF